MEHAGHRRRGPAVRFGRLDHAVFERLLDLLGRALAAHRTRTGPGGATTSDGQVEIVLRSAPRRRDRTLTTPRGVFTRSRLRDRRSPRHGQRTGADRRRRPRVMSQLANQLVIAEREEVARGIRLLLCHAR